MQCKFVGSFLFWVRYYYITVVRQSKQQDRLEGFMHSPVQLAVLFNVLAYIYFFLMFCFTSMSRLFLPFKAWHLRGPSDCNLGNVGIARTFCTISFKQKQAPKTLMDSLGLL